MCGEPSCTNTFVLPAVENWVNVLLPARSFGKIILTTSAGIMDHEEARRKHVSRSDRPDRAMLRYLSPPPAVC